MSNDPSSRVISAMNTACSIGQGRAIVLIDRIHHFIGLLDDIRLEIGQGLLAIPWTAVRSAQAGHQADEVVEGAFHGPILVPRFLGVPRVPRREATPRNSEELRGTPRNCL